MDQLGTLYNLAMCEKWYLIGGAMLLFTTSGIAMAFPVGIGQIIDQMNALQEGIAVHKLNDICFQIIGVYILKGVCTLLRIYLMSNAEDRITRKVKSELFSAMMQQEMGYFDNIKSSELVHLLQHDTEWFSYYVITVFVHGLKSIFVLLFGVITMFSVSSNLSYVALFLSPVLIINAKIIGHFKKLYSDELHLKATKINQFIHERISNVRTVRAFSQEEKEVLKFKEQMADMMLVANNQTWVNSIFQGGIQLGDGLSIAAVVYFGGGMIIRKEITPGALSSFLLLTSMVSEAIDNLSRYYTQIMKGLEPCTRVKELTDRVPSIRSEGGVIPGRNIEGKICFENVSFSYPSRPDLVVLDNVNIDFPAGSIIGIVGGSGSGKSTLVSLLLRLYDPTKGIITLDDMDICSLDPQWLRQQIGTVSQDPVLFSGNIRDNILYGAPMPENISDQTLFQVSKCANATEFILRFPEQFETIVGERGSTFSGGQRQRIAIARALINNPKILLFDEATSALDAENERLVQEALERVAKNRTVIIIAHRLSTIKNADKIALVSEGKFAEVGTYEDLMKIPYGLFRKLVEKQTINKND